MADMQKQFSSDEPKQYERELNWVEDGVIRYRSILQGAGETAQSKFLKAVFEPLVVAIRKEQEKVKRAKERGKDYMLALLSLPAEKLAFITLQGIFHNIGYTGGGNDPGAKEAMIAREIGQRCWLERRLDCPANRSLNVVDIIRPYSGKSAVRSVRRRVERLDSASWSNDNTDIDLGGFLLSLAVEKRLIRRESRRVRGAKKAYCLEFSTEVEQLLEEVVMDNEKLLEPLHAPMIAPPRPWSSLNNGGYLTNKETGALQLFKYKTWNKRQILNAFQKSKLESVLSAINALQETPWRVNEQTYNVLKEMIEKRMTLPGLQPIKKLPRYPLWYRLIFGLLRPLWKKTPPKLSRGRPNYQQGKKERDRISQWNSRIGRLRNFLLPGYTRRKSEREVISRRNQKTRRYRHIIIPMRLKACEELMNMDIYFPYQLDFRGRVYPIPQVFNPQIDDLGRALIAFAEGKELGEEGEYWFKVHLANTYGKDKESFDDRIKWVDLHEANILRAAEKPMTNQWWRDAEKPWSFLAACFEWKRYRREGQAFRSFIPVYMDGTCNGFQHLSAMALDLHGGRAVNLLDDEKPKDIYQEVADALFSIVQDDQKNNVPEATDWWVNGNTVLKCGKIDRKLVKQATMTTPYGVTQGRIAEEIMSEGFTDGLKDPFTASRYLAKTLDKKAIPAVVKKAIEIKRWLQKDIVGVLGQNNRGCSWQAPTGLYVEQEYRDPKRHEIRVGKLRYVVYSENQNGRINLRKQRQQIVANLVHSMDAAHMILTVNELHNKGRRSFAMIHDSYGVHACDVPLMNRVLREQFVRIYEQPVLKQFFEELCKANPAIKENLKKPPSCGELKIEDVLNSKYFFC